MAQITRTQYKAARRLLRNNGQAALHWVDPDSREVMERCIYEKRAIDPMAVRAELISWCKQDGTKCTPRQTRREIEHIKSSIDCRLY